MKKMFLALGLVLLGSNAFAQTMPNVGLSVGVGTTGISIDAAATYTPYLGARLGVDIMPQIKIGTDLDLGVEDKVASMDELTQKAKDLNNAAGGPNSVVDLSLPIFQNKLPTQMSVEGKLSNTTFHFLVDAYPFGDASSFHITAGAYFGPEKVIKVYNKDEGFMMPVNQWNEAVNGHTYLNPTAAAIIAGQKMIGVELGDYFVTPDATDSENNVEASIKVGGFRPYLGIGFGRAVPKGRVGVQFDLGCQFWGSPEVVAPTYDKDSGQYTRETTLEESNAGGDAGGVIKVISKVSVYPCMTLRITGRIL